MAKSLKQEGPLKWFHFMRGIQDLSFLRALNGQAAKRWLSIRQIKSLKCLVDLNAVWMQFEYSSSF